MPALTRPGVDTRRDAAIRAIAARMEVECEALARYAVDRYRSEIFDYHVAEERFVSGDVYAVTLDNFEALLANLARNEPLSDEQLEKTRRRIARRAHQGIPLESVLHAARLWGHVFWERVLETASVEEPVEREAALEIAGRVLRHVDLLSTSMASAYLAEVRGISSDREVLCRDLLEALVTGRGDSERIHQLARSLCLELCDSYLVVVIRRDAEPTKEHARLSLRATVDAARAHLHPSDGSLLVGMRQGEVVALYPVVGPAGAEAAKEECEALARSIEDEAVSVGVSGWHPGATEIDASYAEAQAAVGIALGSGVHGRAVGFDEVLVDHMVRSSPHAERILEESLRPLLDYDRERQSELVPTLRAYFDSAFNLTKSAEALSVHPNTVVYRLRRIKELSGRDPHDPDDLLLLLFGLKLSQLAPAS